VRSLRESRYKALGGNQRYEPGSVIDLGPRNVRKYPPFGAIKATWSRWSPRYA
jgi:hypothetical protein